MPSCRGVSTPPIIAPACPSCTNTPPGKKNVTVTIRVYNAALIREHRHKSTLVVENIAGFLGEPPGIFAAFTVKMIAAAQPVESSNVQPIAPHIEKTAVRAAITGNFTVAVKFSTQDAQPFTADFRPVIADCRYCPGFFSICR